MTPEGAGFEAFFLAAEPGARFALFHRAKPPERGGILYVHPFAEELNKSRRMSALQARAFARVGYSVLQVDLYGCGDSSGDFADARWEIWKRDLVRAADWLSGNCSSPLHWWGLRLGATLALEVWRDMPQRFSSAVIWQPVVDGEPFMTQFLRLALAGDLIRESGVATTTDGMRQRVVAGKNIEVAGYEVAPELVAAIDARRMGAWSVPGGTVHWLDVRRTIADPPGSVRRTLDAWQSAGVDVDYQAVVGDAFWSSFDIIEVPELVSATTACYTGRAP